jgi:hypothetical protein
VQLRVDADGNLRVKAAAGVLTSDLLRAIGEAKPALLSELRGELVNFVNLNSRLLDPATIQRGAGGEVRGAWLLHFRDRGPKEVHFTPGVSHAEALTWYPLAVAAEPIEASSEQGF